MIRVLHVTDPHLFADPAGSLRGTVTLSSFQSVLAHFESSEWPADFMAMTGDVIQDSSSGAYDQFRDLVEPLDLPIFCVPGNHDVRGLMRDALSEPPFRYCATLRRDNWLVVGIDSCVHDSAQGCIDDAEMRRLEDIISSTDAEHVLVCLHHPPLPMGSTWLDTVGLSNREEFLQIITQSGLVRAAIFGHVHQDFDQRHESIHIIGTPSTCRQFKAGSDEFELDDNPPAYRRIDLHSDGTVQSELIWLPS